MNLQRCTKCNKLFSDDIHDPTYYGAVSRTWHPFETEKILKAGEWCCVVLSNNATCLQPKSEHAPDHVFYPGVVDVWAGTGKPVHEVSDNDGNSDAIAREIVEKYGNGPKQDLQDAIAVAIQEARTA